MSFIQNLFTSRDNNANAASYVGQQDRLWWNPDTNSLYYSDGSTPGGIPVGAGGNPFNQLLNTYNDVTFANVTVTGNLNADLGNIGNVTNISVIGTANLGNLTINDQTIAGTVDGRDITVSPVGTGTLRTLNGIGVYQGSFESIPLFSVSTSGVVSTLVPNATSYLGALEVIGNPDGDTVAPQNYGVMIHTTGVPDVPARNYNDGVNAYGVYINRRYNGTSAAPTGVLADQIMGRVGATPYVDNGGAGIFPSISTTRVDFIATEDQTTTSQGSKIQILATGVGESTPTVVADLAPDNILLHGNLFPSENNIFSLGNNTLKWDSVYIGPSSLFIEDTVLGTDAEITVYNGALLINGTGLIQVGNMQMTTDGISLITANTGSNIQVGASGDTGYMQINMPGIKFRDGSIQTTAAIPLTQKGVANGVATLGSDGKVTPSELPAGSVFFKGTWDAATNTPTLADGSGTAGWEYQCNVAGTVNFGSGPIAFSVGDFVIYNGSLWQRIPGSGSGVTSFNGRTGAVTLQSSDVTTALSNSSITNNYLSNPNISIATGQGIGSNKSTVELGTSVTLTNTGVIAAVAGTGVGVSAATGNVTFSIGQAVGTANSVQFLAVSATQTIQATGNVTGGNITTAGRIVATGNIVTGANVVTPGTIINSSVSTSGNIIGANLVTGGLVTATGTVTGGNLLTGGLVSATGNVTGGNIRTTGQVSATGNITGGNLTVTGISNLNSNTNVKISGGTVGQSLITDGAGNLSWQTPQAGNVNIINGTVTSNATVDFTYNSTTLIYLPTGPTVNITLQNYTAGHQARVMIRFATNYPIATGIANASQSSEGLTTIPISGGGGHNTRANTTVQLLYTCFDNTAANCYVAATYF